MDETSQVPRKELLHVHKVSDCARFFHFAQYALGIFYVQGRGSLPKDDREAIRLLTKALSQ